jgi:hypothetical protein
MPPERFTVNAAVCGNESRYVTMTVDTSLILKSWRESLFSYEWMHPDGRMKAKDELPATEQIKRDQVERAIAQGSIIEKPVLGIGLLDNVEIGAGKAVFLTLAALGVAAIPVHIPASHADEFEQFTAQGKQKPRHPPRQKSGHKPRSASRVKESGNIVFYILVAVVVLAALIAAVARTGRETITSLTSDQQRLLATEIIGYGDSMAKAAAQMRLRGTKFNQFSFASPDLPAGYGTYGSAPTHEIFNPSGGGINYKQPPATAMTTAGDYSFVATNAINNVGMTCAAASCVELLIVASPLRQDVCSRIDALLGIVTNDDDPPPEVAAFDALTPFAGTAGYSDTVGGTSGTTVLDQKSAACVKNTGTGLYNFYQVLQPQ